MYYGHVFDSITKQPLSGLRVSDGLNIAVTDDSGAFSLPGWERAHVIAVQCLTNAHDDWFRMIDGHEGDFDFYISPAVASADHSFFQISDSEISDVSECEPWLHFVKARIAENAPAFLVHTGDICRIRGLESHRLAMNFDTMGIPVRYTLGNHDYVADRYGEYSFERMYGPVWYSFDLGNTHYVVLPIKSGEAPGCYLPEDADRWLYNDLCAKDPEKSLVLFSHTHCPDEDSFVYRVDGKEFCLRDYGLLAWVFGHYHINFCTDLGGYYNICTSRPDCGGIDSSPTGIRRVEIFADGTLKTNLYYNDLSKAAPADPAIWDTKLPGHVIFADPLLDDRRLYIATADDGHPCNAGLFCLDAESGAVLWSYPTYAGLKNIPALADGVIYAQDAFGWVYALDKITGALLWKTLVELHWAHHAENGVAVADGKVFCGSGRMVTALRASDGAHLWTAEHGGSEDTPARFVYTEAACGKLLICSRQWRHVYALNAETGETVWRNAEVRYATGTPLPIGDTLVIHSANRMFRLDLQTGETLAEYTPDPACNFNTACQSVLRNGILYTATADCGMLAADAETLEPLRFYAVGETLCPMVPYRQHDSHECESAPIFDGNAILFTSPDGYLHICDTETTKELCKYSLGAPCYVSPVLWGRTVICADFCGHVRAFSAEP